MKSNAEDRISEKIAFEKRLDEVDKECCNSCVHFIPSEGIALFGDSLTIGTWCQLFKEYKPYCVEFEAR